MNTDRDQIETKVLAVLREVQELSGRTWADLGPHSKPIGDLDGFDSLIAIEVTVLLEEKLGCSLDKNNLFVSEDGTRALSLKEVTNRISELLAASGGKA
ncbi:MAG: acyl carrier protein [Planctomycetes bacterium]|nr:acyl carrier protein [Planctomycetota bacterium]